MQRLVYSDLATKHEQARKRRGVVSKIFKDPVYRNASREFQEKSGRFTGELVCLRAQF